MAGGLSSRLGLDKTRLHLHGVDRPTLLERTITLLREHTDEVVLSCRAQDENQPGPDWGQSLCQVRQVPDPVPSIGPLGGLFACLSALPGPLLVLSCDLPFMDHPVLERLLRGHAERPREAIMTTFQQNETGYIEALVAVYESACLPYFQRALQQGVRQLNLVVPEALRHHLPYGQEQALPFFNVNYPSDLALARQVIKPS